MDVGIRVCRIYAFPPFRMDPVRRTLTRDGERIDLTARLFDTLLYLVENHHRVVSRDELERAIWGGRNVAGANVAVAISALRRCLQTPGSPSDVIKTISGQGYQLDRAVVVEPGLIPMVAADAAAPGAPANVAPRRRARVAAAVCVAALVTASAAAYWAVRAGGGPAQEAFTPPPRSIAVLPFKNASGDPARDYFSDGISEELIDSLSQVRALHVAARQSAFSFKGTPAREQDIARRLNVAAVLGGSVRQDGGRLVIGVHLTDGTTGRELWANTYDRAAGDVLEIQTELARSVTGSPQGTARGYAIGDADAWGHHGSRCVGRVSPGYCRQPPSRHNACESRPHIASVRSSRGARSQLCHGAGPAGLVSVVIRRDERQRRSVVHQRSERCRTGGCLQGGCVGARSGHRPHRHGLCAGRLYSPISPGRRWSFPVRARWRPEAVPSLRSMPGSKCLPVTPTRHWRQPSRRWPAIPSTPRSIRDWPGSFIMPGALPMRPVP